VKTIIVLILLLTAIFSVAQQNEAQYKSFSTSLKINKTDTDSLWYDFADLIKDFIKCQEYWLRHEEYWVTPYPKQNILTFQRKDDIWNIYWSELEPKITKKIMNRLNKER